MVKCGYCENLDVRFYDGEKKEKPVGFCKLLVEIAKKEGFMAVGYTYGWTEKDCDEFKEKKVQQ